MTNQDVITRAFRMLGMKDEASNAEAVEDALSVMQSLVLSLPGATWWRDVVISDAYDAGENERIFAEEGGPFSIMGPQRVSSGHTVLFCCDRYEVVCGGYDDRPIRDGARVQLLSSGEPLTQMYRADRQQWVPASGLTLTGTLPINADLADDFAAYLAVRIAPEYSVEPGSVVLAAASSCATRMRARYGERQDVAADLALLRTSSVLNDGVAGAANVPESVYIPDWSGELQDGLL